MPCDLSHHAFDVTCMLPPHQLRPTNSAAAYILLVGHVTCKACWDTPPRTEFLTHACENITFRQLLLRAVKMGRVAILERNTDWNQKSESVQCEHILHGTM